MLSYEDARSLVFEHVKPLGKRNCPLTESQGLALSEDILAPHGLPLFDNSAVDGYAVQSVDLVDASRKNPVRLKKMGYIAAGDTGEEQMNSGQCLQIATGAPLPPGADTVVMKEDIELNESFVYFTQAIPKTQNVRNQGEDIPEGRIMIPAGTLIGPAQIAVLATFGYAQVPVHRLPKISIVSTGSELVDVEGNLQSGQIRESNRFMLAGMVRQESCELVKISLVPDIPEILIQAFEEALQTDVALISGGMSVGDKDFAKPLLKEMGVEEIFWKIKFKPGKPLFFGRRGKTLVFGLPGNPASSYVLFEEFARPALRVYKLAPAYDFLNTTIALHNPKEESALPLKGKKRNFTPKDLTSYLPNDLLQIPTKSSNKILNDLLIAAASFETIIEKSFLSKDSKDRYAEVLEKRLKILSLKS